MEALGAEDAELLDCPRRVWVEEVAGRPAFGGPSSGGDLALSWVDPRLVVDVEAAEAGFEGPCS
eukprot:1170368-Lingulodinium_polyedra.AAC.1